MEEERNAGFDKTVDLFGRETSLAEINVWSRLVMLVVCVATLIVNIARFVRGK